jgi:hypothetical protein
MGKTDGAVRGGPGVDTRLVLVLVLLYVLVWTVVSLTVSTALGQFVRLGDAMSSR